MLFPLYLVFRLAASLAIPSESSSNTTAIAGITVPSSPLITKALTYVRDNSDDPTYNHVVRTWLNAMASISHLPSSLTQDLDLEAITIASLLHDLGWSNNSALISNDTRFEVNGADLTRAFLVREGDDAWDKHRLQLVWDSIALHTTADINQHKQPEVALMALGVYEDIIGPTVVAAQYGADRVGVTQEEWEHINQAYPRLDLKNYINGVFTWLCETKPATTYDNAVGDWGEESVEGYNRTGKRLIDVIEDLTLP